MNPNASTWTPNTTAPVFVPGAGLSPAPSSTPSPASASPEPAPVHDPALVPETEPPTGMLADLGVDESDPLWQAVLEIAGGDCDRALRLLNNPDQLTQYPQISALLSPGVSSAAAANLAEAETKDEEPKNHDDHDFDEAGDSFPETRETNTFSEKTTDTINSVEQSAGKLNLHEGDENYKSDAIVDEDGDENTVPKSQAKEGDPREHLNLVFIGHVDAGKSTLAGNILYLTDNVDKRTIERYEREAKERGRESWFLAFIMDTNDEERAKGKTVEVGKAHFETEAKRYTILDAPGHKNYVPNMIQGASQADVGILVISARKGEFETGFDRGGQTREHAMLAKTLGVSYLIVAVNKMDEPTVQWKKERFDECVNKIRPYLKSCGFVIKREVKFIPISGLSGPNVKTEVTSEVCSWWKACYTSNENNTSSPTLLSLLDSLEIQGRDTSAPLRVPVLDRYTDRGVISMGKVESGVIRPGMKVRVMPSRREFKVEEVWANEDPVTAARPGENVLVKLANCKIEDVRKGYVICTEPPCRAVTKIICQIAIVDMPEHTRVMTAGFQCMFHAHTSEEECSVSKVFETTNNKGQVVKGARFAGVNMRAIVMLELTQTVCVEIFDNMPFLGRFTLRTEGKTVAIGKVTKLPPKKD